MTDGAERSPGPAARLSLDEAVGRLAAAPDVLVVADFDGTLSPIVPEPDAARPDPEALAALARVARLARTRVVIVSGRSLTDLRERVGTSCGAKLVGSHGAEVEGVPLELPEPERSLREALEEELTAIADNFPGALVEAKPASVALHYRGVDGDRRAEAAAAARAVAERRPGVHLRAGKMVVELLVVAADKGAALRALRTPDELVLFVGDDVTDEDAFLALGPADVGVKVGEGRTRARWRLPGQPEVAGLLARLAEFRLRDIPTPEE